MDDYEKRQVRLNRELISIKLLGRPLISLSVRDAYVLGMILAVCVLAWMLGPKNVFNHGERFNQGFWTLIAYLALMRSIILKFEKRIENRGKIKARFNFSVMIGGGALFLVWAGVLALPWRGITPSGQPFITLVTMFWIVLAYLHSDWFWVRSRNPDDEAK
jgi:hypothetical protein